MYICIDKCVCSRIFVVTKSKIHFLKHDIIFLYIAILKWIQRQWELNLSPLYAIQLTEIAMTLIICCLKFTRSFGCQYNQCKWGWNFLHSTFEEFNDTFSKLWVQKINTGFYIIIFKNRKTFVNLNRQFFIWNLSLPLNSNYLKFVSFFKFKLFKNISIMLIYCAVGMIAMVREQFLRVGALFQHRDIQDRTQVV